MADWDVVADCELVLPWDGVKDPLRDPDDDRVDVWDGVCVTDGVRVAVCEGVTVRDEVRVPVEVRVIVCDVVFVTDGVGDKL